LLTDVAIKTLKAGSKPIKREGRYRFQISVYLGPQSRLVRFGRAQGQRTPIREVIGLPCKSLGDMIGYGGSGDHGLFGADRR
jgi:hypothetical protein